MCRYKDHDTAISALRNLNGQEVGGRPLRIDLADSDPFLEGKTTVRGELVDAHETRAQWRERERERNSFKSRDHKAFIAELPPGIPVPLGKTAGDLITEVLATTPLAQIFEVLAQMKVIHLSLSLRYNCILKNIFFPGVCDYTSRTSPRLSRRTPATRVRDVSGSLAEQYCRSYYTRCKSVSSPCLLS